MIPIISKQKTKVKAVSNPYKSYDNSLPLLRNILRNGGGDFDYPKNTQQADSIANRTIVHDYFNKPKTDEWWKKSSGRADITSSPIDAALLGGVGMLGNRSTSFLYDLIDDAAYKGIVKGVGSVAPSIASLISINNVLKPETDISKLEEEFSKEQNETTPRLSKLIELKSKIDSINQSKVKPIYEGERPVQMYYNGGTLPIIKYKYK